MKKTYTKYTEITPCEALQALADNNGEPVEGLVMGCRKAALRGIPLTGVLMDDEFSFWHGNGGERYCARVEEIDPRQVPEGCPPLPKPWLAFLGKGPLWNCRDTYRLNTSIWQCLDDSLDSWDNPGSNGMSKSCYYAIDVRTDFAKEHFPEIVACYDPSVLKVDPFEDWLDLRSIPAKGMTRDEILRE